MPIEFIYTITVYVCLNQTHIWVLVSMWLGCPNTPNTKGCKSTCTGLEWGTQYKMSQRCLFCYLFIFASWLLSPHSSQISSRPKDPREQKKVESLFPITLEETKMKAYVCFSWKWVLCTSQGSLTTSSTIPSRIVKSHHAWASDIFLSDYSTLLVYLYMLRSFFFLLHDQEWQERKRLWNPLLVEKGIWLSILIESCHYKMDIRSWSLCQRLAMALWRNHRAFLATKKTWPSSPRYPEDSAAEAATI